MKQTTIPGLRKVMGSYVSIFLHEKTPKKYMEESSEHFSRVYLQIVSLISPRNTILILKRIDGVDLLHVPLEVIGLFN